MTQDYKDGWNDCFHYLGEASGRSADYRKGFGDCYLAYARNAKNGKGWQGISRIL